jgi:two-component system OmpR family response regulator
MILTKPIDPKELRAYLRILTARSYKRPRKNSLQVGELKLNVKTKMVTHKEHELDLRRKEYEILEYLMINKGNIVSKANLLEQIWEEGICVMSNTLEVHMKNLRDKVDRPFGSKLIKTVRGFGYKISE